MDDDEISIKTRIVADTSGADKAERALGRIEDRAKKSTEKSASSFKGLERSLGGVSRAAGVVQKVLAGFGMAGAFLGIASAVTKIKESFGAAKKEAEEFAAEKKKAEHREAVEALAESYKNLAESMREAAAAHQHENELLAMSVKNARDLEDAQMALAEQRELDAVDDSDPAAAEKKAQIQARYAARRGELAASREKEDVVYARQRYQEEADAKRRDADKIEASVAEDDAVIAEAKRRRNEAAGRSVSENDADATGFWSGLGNNVKNIVGMNWGKVGDSRTAEGDAKRKEAEAEAKELDEEIKRLEKERDAKLKEAQRMREEAQRAEEKKDELGTRIEIADVNRETADVTGRRGTDAADRARGKKEREIAADRATIAAGADREAEIQGRIDAAKARLAEAEVSKDREAGEANRAQQELNDFNAANPSDRKTGAAKRRGELKGEAERERREAEDAELAFKEVKVAVGEELARLKEEMQRFRSELKAAENRQKTRQEGGAEA